MMGPAASRGRAGRLTAIGVALGIIVTLSGCATPKPQAPIGGAMRAATARTAPVARSPHTRTAKAQGNIQMSGAAGDGIANGDFGRWRGTPVTIGGAWDDMPDDQTVLSSIMPDGPWGSWQADLDIAIGAIYKTLGESWAAAASGAYDDRWRSILTRMAVLWGGRPGRLHIRFAHEFNGRWVPWSVRGSEVRDFKATWRRVRAIQKEILPNAYLVFAPNDGTSKELRLDWRKAFPGKKYVDETSVSSFNAWPYVSTRAGFRKKIMGKGPDSRGIERHRLFAKSVGLPMAISEWGTSATLGDGAVYVREFAKWLRKHAGTGPGQVPYEIVFNLGDYQGGKYQMFPTTRMPKATEAYRKAF